MYHSQHTPQSVVCILGVIICLLGGYTLLHSVSDSCNTHTHTHILIIWYRWIYWIDGTNLKKASVTGDDISTLRSDLYCVNVLTIDYASVTIYWIDHCLYEIQSLRLDGDDTTHSFPFTTVIPFATGLVIKNDTFYWSEQGGVFERRNASDATVTTIYGLQRGFRATGLRLVHSTAQPQGIYITHCTLRSHYSNTAAL